MLSHGLDPEFDPAPLVGASGSGSGGEAAGDSEGAGPGAGEAAGKTVADRGSATQQHSGSSLNQSKAAMFRQLEKRFASLNNLTVGEKLQQNRHERALARYRQTEQYWERFRDTAAKKTNRDKRALTITQAEGYRERMEMLGLIDRVTPEFVKSGGHGWYYSLRNYRRNPIEGCIPINRTLRS